MGKRPAPKKAAAKQTVVTRKKGAAPPPMVSKPKTWSEQSTPERLNTLRDGVETLRGETAAFRAEVQGLKNAFHAALMDFKRYSEAMEEWRQKVNQKTGIVDNPTLREIPEYYRNKPES